MMKYNINYKKVPQGSVIKALLAAQDESKIKRAIEILDASEAKYRESKQKKWIVMVIGLILGGVVGYFATIYGY